MTEQLEALRARLLSAQRELIKAVAATGTLPSDNTLRKIADMEVAVGAIEAMLDEQKR